MKKIKQRNIVIKANISDAFFSEILYGKKKPSWETAKKLSEITGIACDVWMENKSNPDTLRAQFKEYQLGTGNRISDTAATGD